MSSEQPSARDSAITHPKFKSWVSQEALDAAQHTPLYPSLSRIGYSPDLDLYLARVESATKRLQERGGASTLPKGWPKVLQGSMVWSGSELQKSNQWVYNLSSTDITEIQSGLAHCKGKQRIKLLFLSPKLKDPIADDNMWQVLS